MTKRGSDFAEAALSLLGTRFCLHGRSPDTGFDCIGLIVYAAARVGMELDAPSGYALRTARPDAYARWFEQSPLLRLAASAPDLPGDIWCVRPAACQLHLMIFTAHGHVHAHSGLRRTVLTPHPSPWPAWRRYRLDFS